MRIAKPHRIRFSGDWREAREPFEGWLAGSYSGGIEPLVTHAVAAQIVAEQQGFHDAGLGAPTLSWDAYAIVHHSEDGTVERVLPEWLEDAGQGVYNVSFGWSWWECGETADDDPPLGPDDPTPEQVAAYSRVASELGDPLDIWSQLREVLADGSHRWKLADGRAVTIARDGAVRWG